MEQQETINPEEIEIKDDFKEYELDIDKINYRLKMEIVEDENILFKIRKIDCLAYLFFLKKYNYNEILKELNLKKNDYNNIIKVFNLIDNLIKNNKIKFLRNKDKIKLEFYLKKDLIEEKKSIYLEEEIKYSGKELNIMFEEVKQMKKNGITTCEIINFLNSKNYDNSINSLKDLEKRFNIEKVKKISEDIQNKIDMLNQIKEKNKDNNKLKELGNILKNKKPKNEISFIFKNVKDYDDDFKIFNEKSNVKINDVEIFINGVKKELNYSGKIYLPFKGLYYVKLIFNKEIKNCESLFQGCDFLFIDLSFFDAKNVTNIKICFMIVKI